MRWQRHKQDVLNDGTNYCKQQHNCTTSLFIINLFWHTQVSTLQVRIWNIVYIYDLTRMAAKTSIKIPWQELNMWPCNSTSNHSWLLRSCQIPFICKLVTKYPPGIIRRHTYNHQYLERISISSKSQSWTYFYRAVKALTLANIFYFIYSWIFTSLEFYTKVLAFLRPILSHLHIWLYKQPFRPKPSIAIYM